MILLTPFFFASLSTRGSLAIDGDVDKLHRQRRQPVESHSRAMALDSSAQFEVYRGTLIVTRLHDCTRESVYALALYNQAKRRMEDRWISAETETFGVRGAQLCVHAYAVQIVAYTSHGGHVDEAPSREDFRRRCGRVTRPATRQPRKIYSRNAALCLYARNLQLTRYRRRTAGLGTISPSAMQRAVKPRRIVR